LGVGAGNKGKTEFLGPNLISNGDFHDFTMEDNVNSIGHYIFDESYVEEDGLESILSERSGSESDEISNGDFNNGTTGWGQFNTTLSVESLFNGQSNCLKCVATSTANVRPYQDVSMFSGGEILFLRYKYYIPSTNTTVRKIRPRFTSGSSQWFPDEASTLDQWTVSESYITVAGANDSVQFYMVDAAGSAISVTIGDVVYIDDVELFVLPANSLTPSGFSDGFEDEYNSTGEEDQSFPVTNASGWNSVANMTVEDVADGQMITVINGSATGSVYRTGVTFPLGAGNHQYKFKAKAGTISDFYIAIYDETNTTWLVSSTHVTGLSNDWVEYSYDFTTTTASNIRIYAARKNSAGDNQGTFYVKDHEVYLVDLYNPAYQNGGVLEFNGVDQYLNGGDICDVGTGDFTVEAWIKLADYAGSSNQTIFAKTEDSTNYLSFHITSAGLLTIHARDTGGWGVQGNVTTNVFTDGNWHHVAVSVTRSTSINMYVDGVAQTVNATTNNANNMDNTGDMLIGSWDGSTSFLDGYIAEVRISDVARTAKEITQSHGMGRGYSHPTGSIYDTTPTNENFTQKITAIDPAGRILYSLSGLTVGTLYKVEATTTVPTGDSGASIAIATSQSGGSWGHYSTELFDTLETKNFYVVAELSTGLLRFSILAGIGDILTVTNVSMKEVLNAETPTDGFVEDFSQGGAKYGSNMVVNGTFDTDTGWTHGTNTSIAAGVATWDGGQASNDQIYQENTISNNLYRVRYTISNYSAGAVRAILGGNDGGIWRSTGNGTYEEILNVDNNSNSRIQLQGNSTFAGSVDNYTVQKVVNGNHGYMYNSMEADQPTHPFALEFDGVDQYVDQGNNLNMGTSDFLWSVWVKMDNTATQVIMGNRDAEYDDAALFITSGGIIYYRGDGTSGSHDYVFTGTVPNDEWTHIAIVNDRNVGRVGYINGVIDATGFDSYDSSSDDKQSTVNFMFGRNSAVSQYYVDGKIGMVTIYKFPNSLPSNYETAIIKKIYDNTKGYYEDE
jgi:hypothetical protein